MDTKMQRFLLSIGIKETERFDVSFSFLCKNQYDPKKIDMVIRKKTPWDYQLLDEFVNAVGSIKYPFSLRFTYEDTINEDDVRNLFEGFCLCFYKDQNDYELSFKDNELSFFIANDEDGFIKEFISLLDFITYDYSTKVVIKESKDDEPIKEEVVPQEEPISTENLELVNEEVKEEELEPIDNVTTAIEEEPKPIDNEESIKVNQKNIHKALIEEEEQKLIDEMHENYKKMMEERNKKRIYTVGDYKPVDHLDNILSMGLQNVDFVGDVFQSTIRLTKKGKNLLTLGVGDADGAISCRAFEGNRIPLETMKKIVPGVRLRIRGAIDDDKFSGQRMIQAHFIDLLPPKEKRSDNAPIKRVELHLHTKMSTMDGLGEMPEYIALAGNMGMDAIAITDHGCVQGFPLAQDSAKKYTKATGKPMKIIYGSELYVFNPKLHITLNPCSLPLKGGRYCVFDTETTGLSSRHDRIIEFGCVIVEDGVVKEHYNVLVNPKMHIPEAATAVNHITDEDVASCPTIEEVMPTILEKLGDHVLVAHNAVFDIGMINSELKREGLPLLTNPVIDTLSLSHYLFPEAARHNEGALLRNLGLAIYDEESAHRAEYDATVLNTGFQEIVRRLDNAKPGITHADLNDLSIEKGNLEDVEEIRKKKDEVYYDYCKHIREHHMVVLAKNQQGLVDLNRIISSSCTEYIYGVPRTPIALIEQYRENLLIGSSCFNGEIFDLALTRPIEDVAKAMEFYDYIEIQPLENYSYLLHMNKISSEERLKETILDIIEAARLANKPVVATGDVHYVDPEDKILRDVFIYAKALHNGSHPMNPPARSKMPIFPNPDQHFRSTTEMLECFSWLGEEKAYEIVVNASRAIADLVEPVFPVSDDLKAPNANLPNSAEKIRTLCEGNFVARYGGSKNPIAIEAYETIKKRLDKELNGIIDHGYAVTYYIAHLLIKMAGEEPEHFIVGSRGSVGSSFAATMADITEVNPLQPHYRCPKCHYLEFSKDKSIKSGFDLPDKVCPDCGAKLESTGQNIPFETFLGFSAEKIPDIDLNFEEESQHRAHNYTKTLLGEKNVFRAGTIEKVAEKTAFGFVRGYFERIGKNPNEINPTLIAYLASRCQGVKRTTGQHPGGIVVVPADLSVYDFTAVQYPADDTSSDWLTTHYDFRSMHDEILKFDILGHVDPMAMRYYRDLTGVKIETIPMNDKRVLSLFTSPAELKLERNYLNLRTGVLALPEFGTNLAQQMLSVAKPKTFNDLLIISGLAHGENVWAGNAEDLIQSGTTDLNGVIGCRDEIMGYFISLGVPSDKAFKLMEKIRKGNGVSDEEKALLRAHKVPEYYIESASKIKYLFPRGHATAYVTMAVRVAYFKLYYPLEFYAVFFSIRSDDYDIKSMIEGEEATIAAYEALKSRAGDRMNPLSNKESNILDTLTVAIEMLQRGYHFAPIDLYRSEAKMFVVDHDKKALIPPFSVIDGLGLSAANSLVEARKVNGVPRPFISREDILERATKLNSTNLNKLGELGVLDGLGETNQMNLFEFI